MKISHTNFIENAGAFTVTADATSGQSTSDMEQGDFSTAYLSNGTASTFTIRKVFTTPITINYIAIAGHNIADTESVEVKVNGASQDSVTLALTNRSPTLMFSFADISASNMDIIITKSSSARRITMSYVSVGLATDVPNEGETAGYRRPWRTKNRRVRTTINDDAAPVAYVRQSMTRKIQLSIPNVLISFTDSSVWEELLERVFEGNDFFIMEDDTDPISSYMCFNAEIPPPTAHAGTRQLNNLMIVFNAYLGY